MLHNYRALYTVIIRRVDTGINAGSSNESTLVKVNLDELALWFVCVGGKEGGRGRKGWRGREREGEGEEEREIIMDTRNLVTLS